VQNEVLVAPGVSGLVDVLERDAVLSYSRQRNMFVTLQLLGDIRQDVAMCCHGCQQQFLDTHASVYVDAHFVERCVEHVFVTFQVVTRVLQIIALHIHHEQDQFPVAPDVALQIIGRVTPR